MSRKRDRPYLSRHATSSLPKRSCPIPSLQADTDKDEPSTTKNSLPASVVVSGLPPNCSVLDLKSRFQIYGSISRIRIDRSALAYITFRSHEFAQSAISAALEPSFGITINSHKVQVLWANDPIPQWREGVAREIDRHSSSKLLRPEVPLSKRGRGNRLASSIVNPGNGSAELNVPFKGREIRAYDDIL